MIGVVIIGRNEGNRLVRCLASIGDDHIVVYVDSGSTDESVAAAVSAGAIPIALDMTQPFTAARARNAGRSVLAQDCEFIQFIDGDCTLAQGWLKAAQHALLGDSSLAAVFGRRREVAPDASIYNKLCDIEWSGVPGTAPYFGGDVMVRVRALDAVGGYPGEMIAGEEPDLSIRLRAQGWMIARIDHEMTLHDAAIHKFGQWWRRTMRSGHAFAEIALRNRASELHDYSGRVRSALFWGSIVPYMAGLAFVMSIITHAAAVVVIGILAVSVWLAQLLRIAMRQRRQRRRKEAIIYAAFLMIGKLAQAIGIIRFALNRLTGRRQAIIEYKNV